MVNPKIKAKAKMARGGKSGKNSNELKPGSGDLPPSYYRGQDNNWKSVRDKNGRIIPT